MKKSLIGLSALIVLSTLSGCGLKGPLYFPPEETVAPDTQSVAQSPTVEEPTQTTNTP